MALTELLDEATDVEMTVLAACWGVPAEDVLDRERPWVQAVAAGDASGPRVVQYRERRLTVYPEAGHVNERWVVRFLAVRALIDPSTVSAPAQATVELRTSDLALVADLHRECPPADLAAARPHVDEDMILARGIIIDGRLVSMSALLPTPAGPPEVSVLTHPASRGQGYAASVERALLVAAAGRGISVVQHRTIAEDHASIALALACGFRFVTLEHLVKPDPAAAVTLAAAPGR